MPVLFLLEGVASLVLGWSRSTHSQMPFRIPRARRAVAVSAFSRQKGRMFGRWGTCSFRFSFPLHASSAMREIAAVSEQVCAV